MTAPCIPKEPPSQDDEKAEYTTVATAGEVLAYHERILKLRRGWLGRVFGWASEKPGNIAGAAIVLAFVFLGLILFVPAASDKIDTGGLVIALVGIITLALGYLFGRADKN